MCCVLLNWQKATIKYQMKREKIHFKQWIAIAQNAAPIRSSNICFFCHLFLFLLLNYQENKKKNKRKCLNNCYNIHITHYTLHTTLHISLIRKFTKTHGHYRQIHLTGFYRSYCVFCLLRSMMRWNCGFLPHILHKCIVNLQNRHTKKQHQFFDAKIKENGSN